MADKEFSYGRLTHGFWRDLVSQAQERQGISFNLENDDSVSDVREVKAGEYEDHDGKKRRYRFTVQPWAAGGDWENPVRYYRCQYHPKNPGAYGRETVFEETEDGCFCYIPVEGNSNLVSNSEGDGLAPTHSTENVDSVDIDDKAADEALNGFLEVEVGKLAREKAADLIAREHIIAVRLFERFAAKKRPADMFKGVFFDIREKAKELKEKWSQEARTNLQNTLIKDLKSKGVVVHSADVKLGKYKGSRFVTSAKLKVNVGDEASANKLLAYLQQKYSPKYKLKGVTEDGTADYNVR